MKSYNTITKIRGLEQIGYQIRFFGKKIWEKSIKPLVLAAGTYLVKLLLH